MQAVKAIGLKHWIKEGGGEERDWRPYRAGVGEFMIMSIMG